jgi:citrate lyase subunit beta/citryl-CoA lyase
MREEANVAKSKVGEAGRRDADVRSDCWVRVEVRDKGGIDLAVKSKVDYLYGESIREALTRGLAALGVSHASVELEDQGAVPFVLMARLEAAAKRAAPDLSGEFLPEPLPGVFAPTERDRFRRSRLYLPGNEPKFFLNAGLHRPDGIILDLEDSVAPPEKDAARLIVRNALRCVDFYGAERMVRINQGDLGTADLEAVVPQRPNVILIPKVEDPAQVKEVDLRIAEIRDRAGFTEPIWLMPIIESALGGVKAFEIAGASPNVVALAVGLEDYTADIGVQRTNEGRESFYLRSQVVNAARAARVQPIDTVFSDVSDMDGLRESVVEAKMLGFDGKGCIHPRQIPVIHEAFAPEEKELAKAKRIVRAFREAEAKGLGVVSLGSKMIDPPVVKRAEHTIDLAIAAGVLAADWEKE